MNINAAIIDQRLTSVCDEIRDQARNELNIVDDGRLKSLAFVYLCVKTVLDLDPDEAFDCLTEGGQDFGVDAIHISEEYDQEFTVSLFQGKYKGSLEGASNFEGNGITKLIHAIGRLFDPSSSLGILNDRLAARVEEARSLIRDGYIPRVRVLACNNGLPWAASAGQDIQAAAFGEQVSWEHVNHDRLVALIQGTRPVSDTLLFSGKALVEDLNYCRVLVGRMAAADVAALLERHGDRLLERNVRRYLGLQGNRVNQDIQKTLLHDPGDFYFFNNGITLTCDKFDYSSLQQSDFRVQVKDLQIINGGQTCMTIWKTLRGRPAQDAPVTSHVLVRLYQLPSDREDLVRKITSATNTQNPVDLRDLKANDAIQRRLELDIGQLGYAYRRKRTDSPAKSTEISVGIAAEAVLSVWRKKPHQAKFFAREHFGKLYDTIFTPDLNGAQVLTAALLYRIAENRRRRPADIDPVFVRYASCFIAMQMGKCLLRDMDCDQKAITHTLFPNAVRLITEKGDAYFRTATCDIHAALLSLYRFAPDYAEPVEDEISLQQLSATFRRGDLISTIDALEAIHGSITAFMQRKHETNPRQ